MKDDTRLYINCMEEVRHRVNLVQSVGAAQTTTGHQVFDVELVFLQLRKVLELIAFANCQQTKILCRPRKVCHSLESKALAPRTGKDKSRFLPNADRKATAPAEWRKTPSGSD